MNLSKILFTWAKGNDIRIAELIEARDKCVTDLLMNGGKDAASGSSGDVSFSFSSASYSAAKWLDILNDAILMLESSEDIQPSFGVERVVVDFRI